MSKTTAVNALPYAEDSDAPDFPAQGKALADALDVLKWGSRNLKPTAGVKGASGDLALTNAYQDVPGASLEITPAVASLLIVQATFDFIHTTSGADTLVGTLKVDADAEQTRVARLGASVALAGAGNVRATVTQSYAIALTAAKHTIKMRAKGELESGVCDSDNTAFVYTLVAS